MNTQENQRPTPRANDVWIAIGMATSIVSTFIAATTLYLGISSLQTTFESRMTGAEVKIEGLQQDMRDLKNATMPRQLRELDENAHQR